MAIIDIQGGFSRSADGTSVEFGSLLYKRDKSIISANSNLEDFFYLLLLCDQISSQYAEGDTICCCLHENRQGRLSVRLCFDTIMPVAFLIFELIESINSIFVNPTS